MPRLVAISRFKAECLGLLEEIAQTGEELVVTKRGRPLARVRPARRSPSLRGSVEYLVPDDELIEPVGQPWDADHR
ncbi:MAG: type II toxin-antitoxin system Phd/YefM family antitoxin [Candidatus Limnocylindria bacterium]